MGSTVLSRRAAVRGAVWSIPAVTVATTAPAFASASGQLSVTDFVASYAPDRPEQVLISATVMGFDTSYQLTVTVPDGGFDSVESATATSASSAGPSASHTLVFTSATSHFQATLDLGSRTELPWRGFQGTAFTISATASADGRQSESTTTAVTAYDMSHDPLNYDPNPSASLQRLFSDSIAAHHRYPGVIGRIVLVVSLPKIAGAAKPGTDSVHGGWTRTHVEDEPGNWLYRFTTTQSHHTSRTGPPGGNPDRGPAPDAAGGAYYEFWVDMAGMPTELVGMTASFYFSAEGDAAARFSRGRVITS